MHDSFFVKRDYMTKKLRSKPVIIEHLLKGDSKQVEDQVAVEEPLQIFIQDRPVFTTLRSPGNEQELALGLCLTEGFINNINDIGDISVCDSEDQVYIQLTNSRYQKVEHLLDRGNIVSKSSCSQCGKQLLEDVILQCPSITKVGCIEPELLHSCRRTLETSQTLFPLTGATHAAGLFTIEGQMLGMAEDVGRHNAMDKVIGGLLLQNTLEKAFIAFITSRSSFEMVQKAARARLGILAANSGPTNMAVELARAAGISLAAFVRPGRCNIYSGMERFVLRRKQQSFWPLKSKLQIK